MPILQLKYVPGVLPEEQNKLMLIEMQGKLEVDGGSYDGMEVGDLTMENGSPFMTIGKQKLKGSMVKLKKPLVIMDTASDDPEVAAKIVQVLEEKIVFNTRPLTIFDK